MSRKRVLLGAGAAVLAAGAFYGYRALGDWLTRQMTGKVKPPEISATAAPTGAAPASTPLAQATSGLDLIVKSAAAAPADPALAQAQADAVRKAGLGMIDSLKPLLNDPALTSRLSPEQGKQYRQLMALLADAEASAKSSGPLDMKKIAADAQKAQQLSLTLMSQLPNQPPQRSK